MPKTTLSPNNDTNADNLFKRHIIEMLMVILFQTYSVRRVEVGEKRNVYVTVAFAGVALMVAMLIGVVVVRRRSSRYPQHQVREQVIQFSDKRALDSFESSLCTYSASFIHKHNNFTRGFYAKNQIPFAQFSPC